MSKRHTAAEWTKAGVWIPPPPRMPVEVTRSENAGLSPKMQEDAAVTVTVPVKPLSANRAWRGYRVKSDDYKAYEKEVYFLLPKLTLPPPPYCVEYEFGFSNMHSDVDNGIKQMQDILSKKYGFNDAHIHQLTARKVEVAKGGEYFTFKIEHYKP